jgi:hypothetical protein
MKRERESQPPPLTLERVVAMAVETALREGKHPPTVIADGGRQSALLQLSELGATHAERAGQMLLTGYAVGKSGRIRALKQVFLVSEAWRSAALSDRPPVAPPSQDPNRKEVLLVMGMRPGEDEVQIACMEMLRNTKGDLVELKPVEPMQTTGAHGESPLLAAFIEGFRVGRAGSRD